ncbi:hypothetical protein GCM10009687_25530 [Asanoa iriomotensis]|uniref:Tetratricopeptide repeat protein n=2 Tax=Asanoa iriomotensis TaxID=234613 RepID=A0ABQ4CFG9_9ACTN|nr:hypothetical protein Air01nite_76170 [Asanoa iriomotensis]
MRLSFVILNEMREASISRAEVVIVVPGLKELLDSRADAAEVSRTVNEAVPRLRRVRKLLPQDQATAYAFIALLIALFTLVENILADLPALSKIFPGARDPSPPREDSPEVPSHRDARSKRRTWRERYPGKPEDPATWQQWVELMPELLAADPAASTDSGLRWVSCEAVRYFDFSDQLEAGAELAQHLSVRWAEILPTDQLTLFMAHLVAHTYSKQGRWNLSAKLREQTLTRQRQFLGEDHGDTLLSANNLGLDMSRLRRYDEAHDLHADTVARRRRILGDDHPATLSSANSLGVDLHMLKRYDEARELHEDTLERRRRVLGDDHPETLWSANNLGNDLRMLRRYWEARDLHEDTLARQRRSLGDDHADTLWFANSLGLDLYMLRRYPEARALHEDTLARRRRILGDDHPDTLSSANNLGNDLYMLQRYAQARRRHEDTLTRRRRVLGDDDPDTLATAYNLGLVLYMQRRYREARELQADTLARQRAGLGDDHPDTGATARHLMKILEAIEGRRLFDSALGGLRRWRQSGAG